LPLAAEDERARRAAWRNSDALWSRAAATTRGYALREIDPSLDAARAQTWQRPEDAGRTGFVRGALLWMLGRSADASKAWREAFALRSVERGEDPGAAIKAPP